MYILNSRLLVRKKFGEIENLYIAKIKFNLTNQAYTNNYTNF